MISSAFNDNHNAWINVSDHPHYIFKSIDLNESLFKLDIEETLAVYAPHILSSMIERQDRIESLMTVIHKINPCIMIVTEVEANHNSPIFVNRFIEALFYYGAYFDSMEECMDRS